MIEREYDISGAIVFWSLQPTSYQKIQEVFTAMGHAHCVPNPRTDQGAFENSVKAIYGMKNKAVVSRKQPNRNGVELVNIEPAPCRKARSVETFLAAALPKAEAKSIFSLPLPPGVGQQPTSPAASSASVPGSGTAEMPAGGRPNALVVVGQHDGQVVDVHLAVVVEVARAPAHRRALIVVRQHLGQVVDVHLAVEVGVAGQRDANRSA